MFPRLSEFMSQISLIIIQGHRGRTSQFKNLIDHLQVVSTNNFNTIAEFHTTNHSTLSLLSLLSLNFT
jgi:hypothetical protein